MEARSNKENTQVDVYMLVDGGKAQGLAIIATEPREFVIVNIVGSIDLEKLHELEKLGVPELEIETGKKTPEKAPSRKRAEEEVAVNTRRRRGAGDFADDAECEHQHGDAIGHQFEDVLHLGVVLCRHQLADEDHQDLYCRARHEHLRK